MPVSKPLGSSIIVWRTQPQPVGFCPPAGWEQAVALPWSLPGHCRSKPRFMDTFLSAVTMRSAVTHGN